MTVTSLPGAADTCDRTAKAPDSSQLLRLNTVSAFVSSAVFTCVRVSEPVTASSVPQQQACVMRGLQLHNLSETFA